jgi:hypothetical protein
MATRGDTLNIDNQYFIYTGKMFKPDLLMNSNHIADKKFYSPIAERTYNELLHCGYLKLSI